MAINLSNKYTESELAQLLVKNKDRRVSNLIASAYNFKVLLRKARTTRKAIAGDDLYDKEAIEYFIRKCRVIGPQSWIYKVLQNGDKFKGDNSWIRFLKEIRFISLSDEGTLDRIHEYAQREALSGFR